MMLTPRHVYISEGILALVIYLQSIFIYTYTLVDLYYYHIYIRSQSYTSTISHRTVYNPYTYNPHTNQYTLPHHRVYTRTTHPSPRRSSAPPPHPARPPAAPHTPRLGEVVRRPRSLHVLQLFSGERGLEVVPSALGNV